MTASMIGPRPPRRGESARAALLIALAMSCTGVGALRAQDDAPLAVKRPGVEWAAWGSAVLLLGGVFALDRPVRNGSLGLRSGAGDALASAGNWLGDWRSTTPILVGGALVLGTLADGSRGARRGASVVLGTFAGSMANEALNVAVGRARPSEGGDPWAFDPFEGHASFPSGHTAYAFSIAGAVDAATESWVPAAAAYAGAALTGASRIYDDRHWLSDVAVGALVGAWTAHRATRMAMRTLGVSRDADARPGEPSRDDRARRGASPFARVSPVATKGFLGLRVVF